MTREEILSKAKPILFNTEMVKAILDGRKTVTRRPVKMKYGNTHIELRTNKYGSNVIELQNNVEGETFGKKPDGTSYQRILAYRDVNPPYQVGDYLYVRETWKQAVYYPPGGGYGLTNRYWYKADESIDTLGIDAENKWRPSIHMPKEAARIFLRVTGVRVERLKDIKNGWKFEEEGIVFYYGMISESWKDFADLWDSTIKKSDLAKYGWDANPWVWCVSFERVGVE